MIRWAAACAATLSAASGVVLIQGGRRVPQADLLRGYAMSRCLAAAYKGQSLEKDANRSAEAYREAGKETRVWVYQELDRLAGEAAVGTPAPTSAGSLTVMTCLELYESRAIAEVSLGRRPRPAAAHGSDSKVGPAPAGTPA
jgi:Type VI secretion system (T6SS), amidase immunity protein